MSALTHPSPSVVAGAVAVCLTLAGCASAPVEPSGDVRSAISLPERYAPMLAPAAPPAPATSAAAPTAGGGSASVAEANEAAWWRAWGSTELNALVERALQANADVLQASARLAQAQGQLQEVSGASLPSLNLGGQADRARTSALSRSNNSGRATTANQYGLSLSSSFEIDLFGRLASATEAARAQLAASEQARQTVRLSVATAVVQSWLNLRALDDQVAQAQRTLQAREDAARIVTQRLQAGSSNQLEASQAEVQRADAAVQLRELQRQRAQAQNLLGVLTARADLTLAPAGLSLLATPPAPQPGLPSALLQRRPDVRQAEAQLAAAQADVATARAALFPTISLSGAFGGQSVSLSRLLEAPARIWSLGFGLSLPLFDGGRRAARVDQAGARQREAVAAYQSAVSQAFQEAADALQSLQTARASEPDAQSRQAAAERALVLAQARQNAGYSGMLEVLDAQRTEAAARQEAVRARLAVFNATAQLHKALGGSLADPAP
jgi:multidrug efflux system outer membrane protein